MWPDDAASVCGDSVCACRCCEASASMAPPAAWSPASWPRECMSKLPPKNGELYSGPACPGCGCCWAGALNADSPPGWGVPARPPKPPQMPSDMPQLVALTGADGIGAPKAGRCPPGPPARSIKSPPSWALPGGASTSVGWKARNRLSEEPAPRGSHPHAALPQASASSGEAPVSGLQEAAAALPATRGTGAYAARCCPAGAAPSGGLAPCP
mmetsp:Transcript_27367/g.68949  ORF Transcript_27367/g.68949 Transcript_27367/m.68949 type:complete len:212 (+) Transcript_27367:437-1072(+)